MIDTRLRFIPPEEDDGKRRKNHDFPCMIDSGSRSEEE
jgi:hypothetical protein